MGAPAAPSWTDRQPLRVLIDLPPAHRWGVGKVAGRLRTPGQAGEAPSDRCRGDADGITLTRALGIVSHAGHTPSNAARALRALLDPGEGGESGEPEPWRGY